jgi:hypothetical protein
MLHSIGNKNCNRVAVSNLDYDAFDYVRCGVGVGVGNWKEQEYEEQ